MKTVMFKVFTSAGAFVRVWPDVATLPSFRTVINGGPSAMTLTLPRAWGAAGEVGETGSLNDLRNGNLVEIWVVDGDTDSSGRLIYQGSIREHEMSDPPSDGVKVLLVPRTSQLSEAFIRGPVTLTDYDPTHLMRYLVDTWLPGIGWDTGNPEVGERFGQTFEKIKVAQAMEIVRRLAGGKWYYRLNADNTLSFNSWSLRTAATHQLNGAHFASVRYVRSAVDVKRRVVVFGAQTVNSAGVVTGRIEAESIDPHYVIGVDEPRDLFHTDPRITDYATGQRVAYSLHEFNREELISTEIDIPDNNYSSGRGYDIESLRVGDTLQLVNPRQVYQVTRYGTAVYGTNAYGAAYAGLVQLPLVIAEVDYRYTSAKVKLTTRPAAVPEAMVNQADRLLLESST